MKKKKISFNDIRLMTCVILYKIDFFILWFWWFCYSMFLLFVKDDLVMVVVVIIVLYVFICKVCLNISLIKDD